MTAKSERERLAERLKGVNALAIKGSAGERDNAAALLIFLTEKHGITDADLEGAEVGIHWIRYKTIHERKLLFQLSYMRMGSGHASGCVGAYSVRKRKEVGIRCTPAQFVDPEELWHMDFCKFEQDERAN